MLMIDSFFEFMVDDRWLYFELSFHMTAIFGKILKMMGVNRSILWCDTFSIIFGRYFFGFDIDYLFFKILFFQALIGWTGNWGSLFFFVAISEACENDCAFVVSFLISICFHAELILVISINGMNSLAVLFKDAAAILNFIFEGDRLSCWIVVLPD